MRRIVTAFVVAPLLTLVACGGVDDDAGTSEDAHTARTFTADNTPYTWVDTTYDDLKFDRERIGAEPVPAGLLEVHPITVRLQAMLDRADGIVRPLVERRLGAKLLAPRPRAKVLRSVALFNAFGSPVPVCVGAPFGTPRADVSASAEGRAGTLLDPAAVYTRFPACERPSNWTVAGAVKYWNSANPTCTLEIKDGRIIAANPNCDGAQNAVAGETMMGSTSPWISFSTDLLAALDESTLSVVLIHELGHYYLGHGTDAALARYGYWYDRDAAQSGAPKRAANSDELERAYRDVVERGHPMGVPSFGSKYSPRMRDFLLGGLIPIFNRRTESDFVCAKARDMLAMNDGDWAREMRHAVLPSEATRAQFLVYEKELTSCAAKLELSDTGGPTSLPREDVRSAAIARRPGANVVPQIREPKDTLGALIDRLDDAAKDLDDKAKHLLEHVRENRIGLYTTEQAADEFALEVSVRMGMTPGEVLSAFLDFMAATDKMIDDSFGAGVAAKAHDEHGELGPSACRSLLLDNFTRIDERGKRVPVVVSLGDLSDKHHSTCYRIYNLWRETRVHTFVQGRRLAPLTPEWEPLRAQAAELSKGDFF